VARLLPLPAELAAQPEGSYLVPIVIKTGERWVTEMERSRCAAGLQSGTSPKRSRPWARRATCCRSARRSGWPA
jgi:hypothetical protein